MNPEALQWFVDVVRHGSFSEVARRYGVAPSSISRAITNLEEDLGVRLFQRTTREVVATEAAELFHRRVVGVLEELELAKQQAVDTASRASGRLRVGAASTFAHMHVIPHLERFLEQYPDILVEFILEDGATNLVAGHIDVSLRLGQMQDTSLIARKLCAQRRLVCASPEYLATHGSLMAPSDLCSRGCLVFPHDGFSAQWRFRDEDGQVTEVDVQGKVTIGHGLSLKDCALRGLGVAVLPEWLIYQELEAGTLVTLLPDYEVTTTVFDTALWLVYPSRQYMPLRVRVFLDFVLDLYKGGPPWQGST